MSAKRDNSVVDLLLDYKGPILFWACPKRCDGRVSWRKEGTKHIAKCEVCGEESKPK